MHTDFGREVSWKAATCKTEKISITIDFRKWVEDLSVVTCTVAALY
jgi:hypothetical protein